MHVCSTFGQPTTNRAMKQRQCDVSAAVFNPTANLQRQSFGSHAHCLRQLCFTLRLLDSMPFPIPLITNSSPNFLWLSQASPRTVRTVVTTLTCSIDVLHLYFGSSILNFGQGLFQSSSIN